MTNREPASQEPQKLAPNSQESEEATLGAVLINPDVMPELTAFLYADDFYFMHHRFIWEALLSIHERKEGIDALTVVEELRYRRDRDGQTYLDKVGGSAFITYLINNTPTHVHAETYARIVERLAVRRRLLDAASNIAKSALADDIELEQVIERADTALKRATKRMVKFSLKPMDELTREFINEMDALQAGGAADRIVPTGFIDLDKLLGGGVMKGELVVVAGRPGMGKTAAEGSMIVNMAQTGQRVAVFELEMKASQLVARIFSSATNISTTLFRSAGFDDLQWDRIIDTTRYVEKLKVWMDDTPARTLKEIRDACWQLKRSAGLDVVFVDYLQIMGDSDIRADNRTGVVDKIIQGLKDLAKELDVVVVVASQLSREVEKRADKRPMLSDLRESGNIEAAADICIGLYRDDFYNENSEKPNRIEFIILKSRSTLTGVIEMLFEKWTTTVKNIVRRDHVDLNTLTVKTTTAAGSYEWSADPLRQGEEE